MKEDEKSVIGDFTINIVLYIMILKPVLKLKPGFWEYLKESDYLDKICYIENDQTIYFN
jgi:hypothetical protein